MEPTEPSLSTHNTPSGTRRVVFAEHQPEYIPLPSYKTPDGRVVSAWRPSANELALLNNGVPVYLTLHTFNGPLQPIMMTVGEPQLVEP